MSLKSHLVLLACCASALSFSQSFEGFRDHPLPDYVMTSISGKRITPKTLKGKVVLFDFWATWCGPCKAASPAMQALAAKYAKKGLVVIGANVMERSQGPAGAIRYAKEHHFTYTFTYDNNGLAQSLSLTSIPAFALVDRHGIVRTAVVGIPNSGARGVYAFFDAQVKKLLTQ